MPNKMFRKVLDAKRSIFDFGLKSIPYGSANLYSFTKVATSFPRTKNTFSICNSFSSIRLIHPPFLVFYFVFNKFVNQIIK